MSLRAIIATFQCDECGETEIIELDPAQIHQGKFTEATCMYDMAIKDIADGGHFSSLHISGETSKDKPTSVGCSESGAPWQTMCRDCTAKAKAKAKTEKP